MKKAATPAKGNEPSPRPSSAGKEYQALVDSLYTDRSSTGNEEDSKEK